MAVTIPVAHDFICPWCWAGLLQARRLQADFGVEIDWRGYELFPAGLYWPDYPPAPERPHNRPETPSRLEFLLAADGITMPDVVRPKKMRTYNAHQAAEYAKTEGVGDAFIERLYRGFWENGLEINKPEVIRFLATGLIRDLDALDEAVRTKKFKKNIVDFDDDAYANDVYNVPTYWIGGERLAEQPSSILAAAVKRFIEESGGIGLYHALDFPSAPADRPYIYVNMVSTLDGKILTGKRHEHVHDLGSKTDHLLMKRIESSADAVILGAESLRATSPKWNPRAHTRVVVTKSGDLPADAEFFKHGAPFVATPGSAEFPLPAGAKILRAGGANLDLSLLLYNLRQSGVRRLLLLGGSELNAQFFAADLVDELFLTLAPKIKLGRDVPTLADGEELPREAVQKYDLLSHEAIGNELFLRYRRN
jgi:hypothetical protein